MSPAEQPSTVTRFAPSPTGLLHVGNLRTAVLGWALARRDGGRFILRLDDTDSARSRPEFADAIRRDLDWLGLDRDAEVRQSDRRCRHRAALGRLAEAGRAYDCFETAEELAGKRREEQARGMPPVYDRAALRLDPAERARLAAERTPHRRFLLEHERVGWDDLIRGAVEVDAASLSDPVLAREDGEILYTLASVVDDAELGVTHVVRGADHLSNTAVQIQLFRALGAPPPAFAHHALMTWPDGRPLSKRHGAPSAADLREAGVEPAALLSFLLRLGSADPVEVTADPGTLVAALDLSRFGAAPTVFDPAELGRHSARTLRALPVGRVRSRLEALGVPAEVAPALWQAVAPNVERVEDAGEWWAICRDGAEPAIAPEDEAFVAEALALLPSPPWGPEAWYAWTGAVKAATGRKGAALYRPLRRALTGRDRGPEMAALMPLLRHAPRPGGGDPAKPA
ncbi:MAG TPA: glutamate--tRNA ligase [Thermohalobaculum sp.]|nr:glutamate--tRNA ligase [Thermohalobaculum sp.]